MSDVTSELVRVHGFAATRLRLRAIARRHAYVMVRSPHRLFDVTLWPLVDVVLFGALAAFVGDDGSGGGDGSVAAGYLLAGIVLWHVIYQSQIAMSTGFLEETWTRNILNLMVTPIREIEYVAGVALFDTWSLGFGLIPIAAVLLVVGWAVSLFVMGLVLRFGSGAEALAWGMMFLLLPLSGVFYPIDALPTVLQPIAELLPTTHAFTALRELVDGDPLNWTEVGIAALGAGVMLGLGFAFVVRMLKVFRRRGYITRYS
jgi:ABC-2 type transport system permease protein